MDQHVQETPKKVYVQPSLESRERLAEVTEAVSVSTTGAQGP
jgi:hypothetical protein